MEYEKYLKKRLEDPKFKAVYEALEPEYQLIRERIRVSLKHDAGTSKK